jgi:hypothetical protein
MGDDFGEFNDLMNEDKNFESDQIFINQMYELDFGSGISVESNINFYETSNFYGDINIYTDIINGFIIKANEIIVKGNITTGNLLASGIIKSNIVETQLLRYNMIENFINFSGSYLVIYNIDTAQILASPSPLNFNYRGGIDLTLITNLNNLFTGFLSFRINNAMIEWKYGGSGSFNFIFNPVNIHIYNQLGILWNSPPDMVAFFSQTWYPSSLNNIVYNSINMGNEVSNNYDITIQSMGNIYLKSYNNCTDIYGNLFTDFLDSETVKSNIMNSNIITSNITTSKNFYGNLAGNISSLNGVVSYFTANIINANIGNIISINSNIINGNILNGNIGNILLINSNIINTNIINGNILNGNIINGNILNGNIGNIIFLNSNIINGNAINGNAINGNVINGNIFNGNMGNIISINSNNINIGGNVNFYKQNLFYSYPFQNLPSSISFTPYHPVDFMGMRFYLIKSGGVDWYINDVDNQPYNGYDTGDPVGTRCFFCYFVNNDIPGTQYLTFYLYDDSIKNITFDLKYRMSTRATSTNRLKIFKNLTLLADVQGNNSNTIADAYKYQTFTYSNLTLEKGDKLQISYETTGLYWDYAFNRAYFYFSNLKINNYDLSLSRGDKGLILKSSTISNLSYQMIYNQLFESIQLHSTGPPTYYFPFCFGIILPGTNYKTPSTIGFTMYNYTATDKITAIVLLDMINNNFLLSMNLENYNNPVSQTYIIDNNMVNASFNISNLSPTTQACYLRAYGVSGTVVINSIFIY